MNAQFQSLPVHSMVSKDVDDISHLGSSPSPDRQLKANGSTMSRSGSVAANRVHPSPGENNGTITVADYLNQSSGSRRNLTIPSVTGAGGVLDDGGGTNTPGSAYQHSSQTLRERREKQFSEGEKMHFVLRV
jgi:hypothetical protein